MKRIIAILLVIASIGTNAYAFSSDTLSQLGLEISGDDEHLVLRSEFIENVLTLLEIPPAADAKQVFLDVEKEDPCFGYVMAAYNKGIVRGEPGLNFRPDDPVTYEEAIKVFVDVLGYKSYVKTGMTYTYVADMTGLTDGINYKLTEYVNEKNMSKMFLNAIDIPMPELVIENGNYKFNTEGKTILERNYNIKKGRGRITAVGEYALWDKAAVGSGYVRIEDEIFQVNGDDFSDYLGMKVDYLYSDDDGELTVISIEKAKNSMYYEYSLSDIEKYTDRKIYYTTEDGKEKYFKLSDNAFVIYNGAVVTRFTEELFSGDNGSIRFICNDSNDCDVLIIKEYDDYFVESVDTKMMVVYDRYNKNSLTKKSRTLDLSGVDEEDITFSNGKPAELADISKNDIISVLKREDGQIEKILVSQHYEEGKISFYDRNENKLTADGKEFRITENAIRNTEIKIGLNARLYLNINGLVAGIELENSGNSQLGFIKKAWYDEEKDICMVKILTKENQMQVFEVTMNYSLDGVKSNHGIEKLKSLLSDEIGFLPQLIRFSLNYEGKVTLIDTKNSGVGEDKNLSLKNIYKRTSNVRYIAGSAGFGNRLPITAETVIFKVPDESAAKDRGSFPDDKYKVISISEFKTDTKHTIEGFSAGRSVYLPDAVVNYSADDISDDTAGMCIISGISDGLNADDEPVKYIEFMSNGVRETCALESMEVLAGTELNIGDVVRMNFSEEREITNIKRFYKISDGRDDTLAFENGVVNSAIDSHGLSVFSKAHVYDKDANLLFIAKSADIKAKIESGLSLNDMAVYDISSAGIVVYDKDENKKVREGSIEDIKVTSSGDDIGDLVIIHVRYSKLISVYVIK